MSKNTNQLTGITDEGRGKAYENFIRKELSIKTTNELLIELIMEIKNVRDELMNIRIGEEVRAKYSIQRSSSLFG